MNWNIIYSGKYFSISWYGVFIAIGITAAFIALRIAGKRVGILKKALDFYEILAIITLIGAFFSAALFDSTYKWIETGTFRWGGITFLGGLIGGTVVFLIGIFVFGTPEAKREFPKIVQVLPLAILIGHAFGRIGCTIAGCSYGVGWKYGIQYDVLDHPVLPTNLFESIFLFTLFASLLLITYKKTYKYNLIAYLFGYGTFRFIIEFFRDDNRGQLLGFITPSQTWSLLMIVVAALLVLWQTCPPFRQVIKFVCAKIRRKQIPKSE